MPRRTGGTFDAAGTKPVAALHSVSTRRRGAGIICPVIATHRPLQYAVLQFNKVPLLIAAGP